MKRIIENAKALHWLYGKGDIKLVRVYADGKVEITAQRTSCQPHKAIGRVINAETARVRMYGHTRQSRD
jgi:hypothetical protein